MEKKVTVQETTILGGLKARKVAIQPLTLQVPEKFKEEAPASDPANFWLKSSKKYVLSIKHCKARFAASSSIGKESEIPFGVPAALLLAYKYHADVILSPDEVWLMVCFGLSKHINLNAEKLRHYFVDHEGKKELLIIRPETFATMNWEAATADFAALLDKNVKADFCSQIACDFSTTTDIERTASKVSMMTTMKHFFEYRMICGSGIRNVYFLGTLDDWKKLRTKVEFIGKFELENYVKGMLFVIDNFIATYEGKADLAFWNYMVDRVDGTGASGMRTSKSDFTGWILNFYPYDKDGRIIATKLKPHKFPSVIFKAPVKVQDVTSGTHLMKFMTGFSGIGYSGEAFYPQLSYAFAEKIKEATHDKLI